MAYYSITQKVARKILHLILAGMAAVALTGQAAFADISRFVGNYSGTAEIETRAGEIASRDMSVVIRATSDGYPLVLEHKRRARARVAFGTLFTGQLDACKERTRPDL